MRIKHTVSLNGKLLSCGVDFAEETTAESFVTGRATDLIHFDQQRVSIAVKIDGM